MADYTKNNGCLDWDDFIEDDGEEYIVLPEGDYVFTVTNFERGRFPGSAKIPACNKATLSLDVETEKGTAHVKTDLILYQSLLFRLAGFFRAIGQKAHGERVKMDWGKVVGSRGRAHFKPRTYTDRDGNERQVNDVDRYYDYDEALMPAPSSEPIFVDAKSKDDDDLPF